MKVNCKQLLVNCKFLKLPLFISAYSVAPPPFHLFDRIHIKSQIQNQVFFSDKANFYRQSIQKP